MKTNTEALVQAWNARPGMFDPSDHDHLFWVATRLLPALKAAMPAIIRLDALQGESAVLTLPSAQNAPQPPKLDGAEPLIVVVDDMVAPFDAVIAASVAIQSTPANDPTDVPAPSTGPQTEPETACNTHSQPENLKTDDSASSGDRTRDIVDTLAYVEPKPHVKLSHAEVMAKMKAGREKAKAARAALRAQQPTTQEPASVDVIP